MLDYLHAALAVRLRSERGASAVEYTIVAAGISLACILGTEVLTHVFGVIFQDEMSDVSVKTP